MIDLDERSKADAEVPDAIVVDLWYELDLEVSATMSVIDLLITIPDHVVVEHLCCFEVLICRFGLLLAPKIGDPILFASETALHTFFSRSSTSQSCRKDELHGRLR